jgi:hypothetical protein
MTPKAGGVFVSGNGDPGENGQIRITDGSGTTTYTTVSTFGDGITHTVS